MQKFFHCSKQVVAEMLPAEVVPRRTVVTVARSWRRLNRSLRASYR
jgi:hypothetical protein